MGFLDFLKTKSQQCPSCGAQGARISEQGTRCPNPKCPYYDPALGGGAAGAGSSAPQARPTARGGGFTPAQPLAIRYRNFEGQEKTFTADAVGAEWRKNHIVVRVAPTGKHIALSRDRIQNLAEVESAFPQRVAPGQNWPSPRERQVLNYHKKHGSTSPLYEKVRAKYPNW
jgi:hypothetical protein